jgi:hypothetical protein
MAHQGRMRFSRYAPLTMCAISAHSAAQCAEIQHGMVPPSSALTARRSSPARPLDSPNRPMRAVTARSPNSHVLALTPCRSSRQQPVAMVPIAWIGWCQDVSTTWHGARTWHSLTSFKRLHRWGGVQGTGVPLPLSPSLPLLCTEPHFRNASSPSKICTKIEN